MHRWPSPLLTAVDGAGMHLEQGNSGGFEEKGNRVCQDPQCCTCVNVLNHVHWCVGLPRVIFWLCVTINQGCLLGNASCASRLLFYRRSSFNQDNKITGNSRKRKQKSTKHDDAQMPVFISSTRSPSNPHHNSIKRMWPWNLGVPHTSLAWICNASMKKKMI